MFLKNALFRIFNLPNSYHIPYNFHFAKFFFVLKYQEKAETLSENFAKNTITVKCKMYF